MRRPWTTALLAITANLVWSTTAVAADTIETFDPGLSDFELYTGYEGLGLDIDEQAAFAEGVVGYGVTPAFSLYLAPAFAANGYLTDTESSFEFGGFGTPLDTNHVDIDVGVGTGTDGEAMAYSPFLELNLDLEPDLALAGLFLRGGLEVGGAVDDTGQRSVELGTYTTVGAYVTVAERHQILTEFDAAWRVEREYGAPPTEIGGLRLGYNFQLFDHLELISEVNTDIPQSDETQSFGAFVGVIACLAPAVE